MLLIGTYFTIKIKKVEDISKLIPADKQLERYNLASKYIKFNDQIIVNIFLTDTLSEAQPDSLIAFADSFENQILRIAKNDILSVRNKITNNDLDKIYDIFYRNLPLFLDDEDYLKVDSLLDKNMIRKTIQANYRNLLSPASLVTKKFITKDPLSITTLALNKLKDLQFDDNYIIYENHILTKDKRNLILFITSAYSNNKTKDNELLAEKIESVIDSNRQKYPKIKAEIFGSPIISAGNAIQIKKDIILTVSIAVALLFVFISLFFKRIYIFFIIFLPAIFGSLFSLSFIYFIQGEISVISIGIGSVLVGISIDYSLHIFTHFRHKANTENIYKDLTLPILISSFTTSAAFLCLLFVSSETLNDLGLFAGISVPAAAIFALLVLPHLLKNTGKKTKIENFVSYNFHKSKALIIILLSITTLSIFLYDSADFESDMNKMNFMNEKLKTAEKNLNKKGNLTYRSLYLVATGKNLDEALRNSEKLSPTLNSLKNKGIIKHVNSVNFTLPSDSLQKVKIQKWNTFWDKQKKDSLIEYINKYKTEIGFSKNAFNQFDTLLEKQFKTINTQDFNILKQVFGKELVTESKELTTVVTLIKLKEENKKNFYKAISENKNIIIVDKKYLTDKIVQVLKKDFSKLVLFSLAAVFIILLIYFGRIELTVITYFPMLLSWLWTLGLMAFFGFKFTVFNIIISTFIFGLGIDYSVFITQGLLQEYRYGTKNLATYKTSIFLSAITTITAIGVLIFAQHPAIKSIAFLSIIGILSVVFISYTLQPILFNFLIKQQGKKRSLPITFVDLFFAIMIFIMFLTGSILSNIIMLILKITPAPKNIKKKVFHKWLMILSKIIVYLPFNIKKTVNNTFNEDFKKPAVIIANHQSHIDITLLLMLNPKIIILTNDWVQKNIFYGNIVKYADFYPVSDGIEKNIIKLQKKVAEGYSVLVFPEGSRSNDLKIKRFHKGAFYLAEKLNVDVLPIIIQGAGDCIPKGEPFIKSGKISINILKRINVNNFRSDNRQQAKQIRAFMQDEYLNIREKLENTAYFKKKLIANYIYKTPVLEHYLRIKIRLENNYEVFDELIPNKGIITDVGCGYGFMLYMLNFVSPERQCIGLDYDCQKINTAQNNISKNDNINFICGNVELMDFPQSDTFIIADVLHYMPFERQEFILKKCINSLNDGGKIIIRDGNSEMEKRHRGTKFTELMSTKIVKFNKTNYEKLYFTSKSKIENIFSDFNVKVKIIDNTKHTSNIIFVVEKN